MKRIMRSLRFRMLLPVVGMTLFVVILLTTMFSRAYTHLILQQEQEVNAIGFETISHSMKPLIESSVSEVRSILLDDRVVSYARLQFASAAELIHARNDVRDYLRAEIAGHGDVFGLLFMRNDGSLFGTLPDSNIFLDDPEENPLPPEVKAKILNTPLGETVWTGPISGAELYGFQNGRVPKSIMIAAWKSVDVRYGGCYAMVLLDDSIFERLFAALEGGNGTWHLFTEDRIEIYHTGEEDCADPDLLINGSNSGDVFYDEHGRPVGAFSMTMTSPEWTLVREVSMEDYEKLIRRVRSTVAILAGVVFLIALVLYRFWLKNFMRQFDVLLNGIVRMGHGDLDPVASKPFSISEFETMHQEIDRTSLALDHQMDTIRRMERERMEQENKLKEQERLEEELRLARELQMSAMPIDFPKRPEFELYAAMTPAQEVGGDFYDFFMIDADHLGLVIADVSGKGIPAALFMMESKTLINRQLMSGCDPATAMEKVSLQLCERNEARMFVTVWAAVLEISTGKGMACNAGHEDPALRRSGESFELIKYKHGMFAGISKKAKYQNRAFELHPGDCLFVFTDGVPEANAVSGEMFGTQRMLEALNSCADSSPRGVLRTVRSAVDAFAGDAKQLDDLTMMCLAYKGAGAVETALPTPDAQ